MSVQQNDDTVATYYYKLKRIWDQLQVLEPFPDCTCGVVAQCSCDLMKKIVDAAELKKLIQFIAGLNRPQ